MSVATTSFLLFLALAVILFRLASLRQKVGLWVLSLLSLLFYSFWNPLFCLPLLVTSALDFGVGRALGRAERPWARRGLVALSLLINLGILVFFKYFNFFSGEMISLAHQMGWSLPPVPFRVALCVGISFYTFQSMSYVLDVYRRDTDPCRSFPAYLAFVSFFPTLLAGPITRADVLIPQLGRRLAPLDPARGGAALFLIALGFLKKGLLADTLAQGLVNRVFDLPGMYSSLEVLAGIYGYAVQIYADFSGYSDIAIGSALLLGFALRDNFNRPYRSVNLPEFWRRWHISFSNWLRDYLFFSLPGNRAGSFFSYFNMVITFALGGLWHGPSWNYLLWGLFHGVGLGVVRLLESRRMKRGGRRALPKWRKVLSGVLTFHFVCVTWIFFRCSDLTQVQAVFLQLARFSGSWANLTLPVLAALAVGLSLQWFPERWMERVQVSFVALPAPAQAALLLATAAAVRLAGSSAVSPFIYFSY